MVWPTETEEASTLRPKVVFDHTCLRPSTFLPCLTRHELFSGADYGQQSAVFWLVGQSRKSSLGFRRWIFSRTYLFGSTTHHCNKGHFTFQEAQNTAVEAMNKHAIQPFIEPVMTGCCVCVCKIETRTAGARHI